MSEPAVELDPGPPHPTRPDAPERPAGGAPSDDDAHRAMRRRRVGLGIATAALTRCAGLAIPIICLPLFVNYLGKEGYGLYESVGALAMWLGLSNAGLGFGFQNRLQDCFVSGDRELARRYSSTFAIALGVIAVAGILLLTVVTPLVDWQQIFPTSTPEAGRHTALGFWVAGVIVLMGFVVGVPYVAYNAAQEIHRVNLWETAGRVVTVAACVAVVYTPLGLVGAVLASSGAAVLVRAVNLVWFYTREKPWLRPALRLFDRSLLRRAMVDGVYAFLLQVAFLAIYQSDKLIIGIALKPEDVTPYAIAGRAFLMVYSVYFMLLMPLWPAYGDALRRGDVAWVRRGLRLSLLVGCGGSAAFGLLLVLTGKWVIPLWTRAPDVEVSRSLLLAMTFTFVIRAWIDARTIAFNSLGIFKPQVVFFGAHAALNFVLALALAKPFGVEGVAWATPISALLTSAWGYPWMMQKFIYRRHGATAAAAAAAAAGAPSS